VTSDKLKQKLSDERQVTSNKQQVKRKIGVKRQATNDKLLVMNDKYGETRMLF
jgi:hypothetical protein